jgi:hypothetical protein
VSTCATKRTYGSARTALSARDQMADPYMSIYWCEPCAGLHLGHQAWTRTYATWGAALQAVRAVHARQGQPRRMRVWKTRGRWHVGWAVSARPPAREPRPLRTSVADALRRAHELRIVNGGVA